MKCDICRREFKNKRASGVHRYYAHKITRKEKENWQRKISESTKENMNDPVMRKKMKETTWNSEERNKKNSKTKKKAWKDPNSGYNKSRNKKISRSVKELWKDPEYREKTSEAHKGNEPGNKGKSLSKKTRERISKATKKAMSRIPIEDWPAKRPEVREKISKKLKGRRCPWQEGSKHPLWKGGKSWEPYGRDFDELLKEKVRERDQRRCQLCMKGEDELDRKLCVHHVDGNKKNNSLDNLVSLCMSCHVKLEWQEVKNGKHKGYSMRL